MNLYSAHLNRQNSLLVVTIHHWQKTYSDSRLFRYANGLDLDQLDDGNGIEATLQAHKAVWHKKCRLKFNKKSYDEQSRRESCTVQQPITSTLHTRSAHTHLMNTEPTCFFVNEPAGSAVLHNASTYSIDVNVRRIALELENTALLAKLAAGDMIAIEAKYRQTVAFTV